MPDVSVALARRAAVAAAFLAAACGGACGGDRRTELAADRPAATAAPPEPDDAGSATAAPAALTAADLDAYARGIAAEAGLVRAARERGRSAATPAERAAAAQGEWEDATIAGGAAAAGMPVARYRAIRATVNGVLETLDFQGRIDGPQALDTTRLTPEARRRLTSDPLAALPPASAAALRARLAEVARAYVRYVTLTAVNG